MLRPVLILTLALALPWAPAAAAPVPAPLACLVRHYAVQAQEEGGRFFAVLPDGTRIPYDDGKAKSFEELLAHPDVEDAFSLRYRPGAIRPVTQENQDPGRVRLEPVFAATYGHTREAVEVVPIRFLDQTLRVNRRAAPAFTRVAQRLARVLEGRPDLRPFLTKLGGTFVWRNIAGTDRRSAHSYGVSVDINVGLSHYWRWQQGPLRWQNQVPQEIVDSFEAEGFIWGGRWYHYDTMHFEYRPELLDPACYPNAAAVKAAPADG